MNLADLQHVLPGANLVLSRGNLGEKSWSANANCRKTGRFIGITYGHATAESAIAKLIEIARVDELK